MSSSSEDSAFKSRGALRSKMDFNHVSCETYKTTAPAVVDSVLRGAKNI